MLLSSGLLFLYSRVVIKLRVWWNLGKCVLSNALLHVQIIYVRKILSLTSLWKRCKPSPHFRCEFAHLQGQHTDKNPLFPQKVSCGGLVRLEQRISLRLELVLRTPRHSPAAYQAIHLHLATLNTPDIFWVHPERTGWGNPVWPFCLSGKYNLSTPFFSCSGLLA